jgi:hypothetical protein
MPAKFAHEIGDASRTHRDALDPVGIVDVERVNEKCRITRRSLVVGAGPTTP